MRLKPAPFSSSLKDNYILYGFILASFILILFAYSSLTKSFYQQDEWMTIGVAKAGGIFSFIKTYSLPQMLSGQGRILALPLTYIFFNLFAFKIYPITVFAIFVHLLNSILVYLVVKKLSRNNFLSFISGLFFASGFISHQAVSWFAAVTTTLPAAFFALLSLYLYFVYLKKTKERYLYFSEISLIVSLNFKESGLFLMILIPIVYLIFKKGNLSLGGFVKKHWLLIFYGLLTFFSRAGLVSRPAGTGVGVTDSPYVLEKIISHIMIYPFSSLAQIFIYPSTLYGLAETLQKINYPFINTTAISGLTAQSLTSEMISIFISLIIISLTLLIFSYYKDLRKIAGFAISYSLLASLPYVIFDKSPAYLESRYYYLIIPGAAIIFGLFAEVLRRILVRAKINLKVSFVIVFLLVLVFLIRQVFFIKKDLVQEVKISSQRMGFLNQLSELYPKIGTDTVFYIEGDTYYTGVKIPFQQGPGYTLMVWYYDGRNIPSDFLVGNFLWGMTEQGYRKSDGFSFGYYWDYYKLREEIRKKTFLPEQVIGLYYQGREAKLLDITDRIRKELRYQLQ